MPPKRNFKKRVFKKKTFASKSKKQKVSVAVKKYVSRTLHANIENKMVSSRVLADFGSYAQSSGFAMNAWPMLPYAGASFIQLPQGGTQGARIGNTVKVRKLYLNYVLRQNPYNLVSNPQPQPLDVVFYLGNVKAKPGFLPIQTDTDLLYQLGNTAQIPTGTTSDLIFDINKDYWNIKKTWRHKLGFSSYSGTGAQPDQHAFQNNDYRLTHTRRMNITSLVNKTMKFQDGVATAQGPNLFLMFQCLQANGQTALGTYLPANLLFFITIEFEDA